MPHATFIQPVLLNGCIFQNMWFPVPLLLPLPQTSPYAPQPSGMSYGSGSFQLQMIPFDRHSFPSRFIIDIFHGGKSLKDMFATQP